LQLNENIPWGNPLSIEPVDSLKSGPKPTLDFSQAKLYSPPFNELSCRMKLCRFQNPDGQARAGLFLSDETVLDLTALGVNSLSSAFESDGFHETLSELARKSAPQYALTEIHLLAPVEQQEVWAVGVTYLRSKKARMEESDFSANAYDKVYDAPRPELFFKSMPYKVVPPRGHVGIRKDARWNVPEPELALVFNSRAQLVGFTIGNDMSSRDIEGENLLYLPQAKIYDGSCSVGPCITVGSTEADARSWTIRIDIERAGQTVFQGQVAAGQIKRSFSELADYLFRSQTFPHGAVLLTGTGIVPPDTFTLHRDDQIRIQISGIGTLENTVKLV
jgi:2-dehydro-3-deoxy-D-arabinonate dehydratase